MTDSASRSSPSAGSGLSFPGCTILAFGLGALLFLAGFSVWSLFRQYGEISKFTAAEAVPVPVLELQGREREINSLAEKLESFRHQLTDNKDDVRLILSPEEINLAIAAYEPLKTLRHTFHVREIGGDVMKIDISFRLNGIPRLARRDEPGVTASDPRFLNATLSARPRMVNREFVLDIFAIDIPGTRVPPEFLGHFSPYRVADGYREHPDIGPVMARLSSATLDDGGLSLNRLTDERSGGEISADQVDRARNRFFAAVGIGASVFLAFVGLLVFLGLRGKARREGA